MALESTQIINAPGAPDAVRPDWNTAEACPHCSATLAAGEEFCPRCGYQRSSWQLSGGDAPATAQASQPGGAAAGRFILLAADGRQFNLPDGETVLGRGEVGLRIDDGFISRQHAKLSVTREKVILADLGSSNGTFIDGQRLEPHDPQPLASGDSFSLGQLELTLQPNQAFSDATVAITAETPITAGAEGDVPEADEPAPTGVHEEPRPLSGWRISGAAGLEFALALGETGCGRKPDGNEIVIPDGFISSRHCRFAATLESLVVTDVGSTNGTFVNGEQLAANTPCDIQPGDSVRLGQLEFSVQHEASAESFVAPDPPAGGESTDEESAQG